MMTALAVVLAQGARPFAMRSATAQFDAAVAYARSLAASSGNGATIVFTLRKDAQATQLPGFSAAVFSGRPNSAGPIKPAQVPPFTSTADIGERTLGPPPFSIFLNGAGYATGTAGAVTTSSLLPSEPSCPGGGTFMTFRFSDPRASDTRTLPCSRIVAGTALIPSPVSSGVATPPSVSDSPAPPVATATVETIPSSLIPTPCPTGYSGTPPDCSISADPSPTTAPTSQFPPTAPPTASPTVLITKTGDEVSTVCKGGKGGSGCSAEGTWHTSILFNVPIAPASAKNALQVMVAGLSSRGWVRTTLYGPPDSTVDNAPWAGEDQTPFCNVSLSTSSSCKHAVVDVLTLRLLGWDAFEMIGSVGETSGALSSKATFYGSSLRAGKYMLYFQGDGASEISTSVYKFNWSVSQQ